MPGTEVGGILMHEVQSRQIRKAQLSLRILARNKALMNTVKNVNAIDGSFIRITL